MDINNLNEVMKKRLDGCSFGSIQEEEVFDIKSKLTGLLKSGTPDNIELAIMVAQGQEFDIDALLNELFDLQFWMDNLDDIPQTSKVEALRFLLSKTSINLYRKGLSALPESIGNLQNLEWLRLYNNNLSSLPESFGNLQHLQGLDLSYNNLSSLPESFGNLQHLQGLVLYNNNLSSLPESIGNLQNLQRLYLYNNNLSSLPESIGNLQNLKVLDLDNNNLSSLPESFGNLQNLQRLDLSGNTIPTNAIKRLKAILPNCKVEF
jgi:Leucine-rich repeat (LRR) protein